MAKRKITLDDLAAMMKRGFDELRKEFLGETGLLRKDIRAGFVETNEHLSYHQTDIDNLTHRVKRLEKFTGIDK